MRITAVRLDSSCPSSPSIDITGGRGEWDELLSLLVSGTLHIPSVRSGPYEYNLAQNSFGLGACITSSQWQNLMAGILSLSVEGEHKEGLYKVALERSGHIRGLRVPIPALTGRSLEVAKGRVYTAFMEGMMHGLLSWLPGKGALIPHCKYWAERYAEHESVVLRGENEGLLREAEMRQREVFGGSFSRLKLLAWAYREARSCYGREPSVEDMLSVLEERKSKISRSQVEQYLAQRYQTTQFEDTPEDLLQDIDAVQRGVSQNVQGIGAAEMASFQEVESLEVLSQMRDQLFTALSVIDSEGFYLTADIGEVIDTLLFRALPLEEDKYTQREELSVDVLRDRAFSTCHEGNNFGSHWKNSIEKKIDQGEFDLVVSVPSPADRPATKGAFSRISSPMDECGEEDLAYVSHLRGVFRPKSFSHKVALFVALKRSIRKGFPPDYTSVEPKDFKAALHDVNKVRSAIESNGYLNPKSARALPIVKELFSLESGCCPVTARTIAGEELRVLCKDGITRPMIIWAVPECIEEAKYLPNPVRRSAPVRSGDAIERLRQEYILRDKEKKLALDGRLKRRDVYVRAPKDGDIIVTRTMKTKHRKMIVTQGYKLVSRLLPAKKSSSVILPSD